MQKVTITLCFLFAFFVQEIYTQNAPITTAGNIVNYGSTAIVPISVENFSAIGSCNLKLVYNAAIVTATAVTKEPILPGSLASNISVPGVITLGWYTWPGVTLPDNTVIFNIEFSKVTSGYSDILWDDDGYSCAWSDDEFNYLNDIPTSEYYIDGSVAFGLNLELKVFLEGPFGATDMSTDLNPSYISHNQPYNTSPWNYAGSENIGAVPNGDVIDWVLVELRETAGGPSTATADKRIARQAGLILRDGSIVSTDGISNLIFGVGVTNNLYAIIWHRNHLGIMSAIPLTLGGGIYSYDFTTGVGQAYLSSQKNLGGGYYGMYAGDADGNGEVHEDDIDLRWANEAGENGYYGGDMNMDSQVNNQDKDDVWLDNLNEQSQVPNL
jgi:hypothetical protein